MGFGHAWFPAIVGRFENRLFCNWVGFTGKHRFIDLDIAGSHKESIGRQGFTRGQSNEVSRDQLESRNGQLESAAKYDRLGRQAARQTVGRSLCVRW